MSALYSNYRSSVRLTTHRVLITRRRAERSGRVSRLSCAGPSSESITNVTYALGEFPLHGQLSHNTIS